MSAERLRELAEAASPGPWHWSGAKNSYTNGPYLATWIPGQGRTIVMDSERKGMRSAQPRFNVDGDMVKGVELAVREAPYRDDIDDVDHPDARFIAAANPTAILALLAELDGLRVRTLTAEQDADRLATAVRVQLECGCPDCAVMAIDADDEHETALRARVAGETGDTP